MDLPPSAVIVLAAGQGTRMNSDLPKVLHPLAGMPMLGHVLKTAAALGPDFLCPVVRHQREQVVAYVKEAFPQAVIADQDEIPGTGRAVQCALTKLTAEGLYEKLGESTGTILVTSGDTPLLEAATLRDLYTEHLNSGAKVTILAPKLPDPTGYGRVIRDEAGRVLKIVEQKDASPEEQATREVNAGTYAFDAHFLAEALTRLDRNNAQGEVYLTDTIAQAATEHAAAAFVLDDYRQTEGCNDRIQLAGLQREYNRRVLERLMKAGVSIVDPDSTWITGEVEVARDVTILPGTMLSGQTQIATNSEIGPCTSLNNVTVNESAKVRHCDLDNTRIGTGEVWRFNQLEEDQPTPAGHQHRPIER